MWSAASTSFQPVTTDPPEEIVKAQRRLLQGASHDYVAVEQGQPERLLFFAEKAAIPCRALYDGESSKMLEIRAPGATLSNTEVRWDAARSRLLLGVWCGDRPVLKVPMPLPIPELAWFSSFHLPDCVGERARFHVARGGVIRVELPKRLSDSPSQRFAAARALVLGGGARVVPPVTGG
jgi:hypothetical protein